LSSAALRRQLAIHLGELAEASRTLERTEQAFEGGGVPRLDLERSLAPTDRRFLVAAGFEGTSEIPLCLGSLGTGLQGLEPFPHRDLLGDFAAVFVESRAGPEGPSTLGRGGEQPLGPQESFLDLVSAFQDRYELAHQKREPVGVAGEGRLSFVDAHQRDVVTRGTRDPLETAQGGLVARLA
jgi:hypothetical protein